MGQCVELVEVTTDNFVQGKPKKQLWIAAAPPEQAIALVLAAVPEGWSAVLAEGRLKQDDIAVLDLMPSDIHELTSTK